MEITDKVKERFFNKIFKDPVTGCWLWQASVNKREYGLLKINKKHELSHRVSYFIHFNYIPENMCILHKCDVPRCVRPDHLFLGTREDNMKDMANKNRSAQGEKNGRAHLNSEQVLAIRNDNRSLKKIAEDYDISNVQVHLIKKRRSWKHL